MKRNNIWKIAILPLILVAVFAFTNLQPQKNDNKNNNKGNKSQEQGADNEKGKGQADKGQGNKNQDNRGQGKENNNPGNGNNSGKGNDHVKGNSDNHGNNSGQGNNNRGRGNSNNSKNDENSMDTKVNRGNGNSRTMNGRRDANIDWGINNFSNWTHPKDRKKVTICHNPSENGSNNGVTINVSENALKAHMNHGDQMGNCTIDYSDRWSSNYIKSRENVYNTYEQTWETMSYGEALLKIALEKLLGVRTNFDQNRSTYTQQELQRREALIYELQNNVTSLENQLGVTRQRLDSDVNIIIQL